MRIDISDARSVQFLLFNEMLYFRVASKVAVRKMTQSVEDYFSLSQRSQGQFTHDERMSLHLQRLQLPLQYSISIPQMVNPYGRIDQNHLCFRPAARYRL